MVIFATHTNTKSKLKNKCLCGTTHVRHPGSRRQMESYLDDDGYKKKKNVKGKEKNLENGESVLASFQTEIQGVVTGTLFSTEDAQSETRKTQDKVKMKQRKSARLTLMHLTSPTSAL